MARLAAIDIGSNAIRLRVVEVDPPTTGPEGPRFTAFRDVLVDRAPVRLGHDVFTKGRLETSVLGAVQRSLLDEYIDRVFFEAIPELLELTGGNVDLLIGTGGNIETLADLCPIPGAFPEGRAIDVPAMRRLLGELCRRSVDERAQT